MVPEVGAPTMAPDVQAPMTVLDVQAPMTVPDVQALTTVPDVQAPTDNAGCGAASAALMETWGTMDSDPTVFIRKLLGSWWHLWMNYPAEEPSIG